eukprot:131252-Prorocentrum_minimum.AAC.1
MRAFASGKTALTLASNKGHEEVVRQLQDKSADKGVSSHYFNKCGDHCRRRPGGLARWRRCRCAHAWPWCVALPAASRRGGSGGGPPLVATRRRVRCRTGCTHSTVT